MKIQTENYTASVLRLPERGQHIIGHQQGEQIAVYQAYNHSIADYALKNQVFGGPSYSYNRMSWIKPNFLWMMFRCGWASKENQERVLAIWVNKSDFENILQEAVFSSFNSVYYENHKQWKDELNHKEVRLQWDPDHNPLGEKLPRRAIQIGMKGSVLESFGKQKIKFIEDITGFVKEQKLYVDKHELDKLLIPFEEIFNPTDLILKGKIGLTC